MIEKSYPDVEVFNLGGGFKVARGDLDKATDVGEMAASVLSLVDTWTARTGRSLKLEIEPGTFLVANAGLLVAEVIDKVTTKKSPEDTEGMNFLKLNTGLNEVTRPALYGA
jgi:diaminopimelate decarboxylase